ncbi:DUF6544 family protein [Devosia sp.]|uniref:DUF6544 family protein n=1 Tax=Devosia sp. TaxID=1871048 RepID=UPI002FC97AC1
MKIILIVVAIIVAVLVVVQLALAAKFGAQINAARERVMASQTSAAPDQMMIPSIVRAFAARAGGQLGGPAAITIAQSAEMKLAPDQSFIPIEATQIYGTRDPGFVWHAWGSMASVVPVVVVDSYVSGGGWLEARIAGSIPVAIARGPDVDRGEAMRFLAELPWNPDAMINAAGLSWRQIDQRTVEVALQTAGGPARVRLGFDETGDIVTAEADDRPRSVGDQNLPTPWIGRFSDYASFGNYRIPRLAEVAWILPEGEFVYWRGEIVSAAPVD